MRALLLCCGLVLMTGCTALDTRYKDHGTVYQGGEAYSHYEIETHVYPVCAGSCLEKMKVQ